MTILSFYAQTVMLSQIIIVGGQKRSTIEDFPQEEGGNDGAKKQCDDRGLGTEWAAGDDIGAVDIRRKNGFSRIFSRYCEAKDITLGEVPCPMDADWQP